MSSTSTAELECSSASTRFQKIPQDCTSVFATTCHYHLLLLLLDSGRSVLAPAHGCNWGRCWASHFRINLLQKLIDSRLDSGHQLSSPWFLVDKDLFLHLFWAGHCWDSCRWNRGHQSRFLGKCVHSRSQEANKWENWGPVSHRSHVHIQGGALNMREKVCSRTRLQLGAMLMQWLQSQEAAQQPQLPDSHAAKKPSNTTLNL